MKRKPNRKTMSNIFNSLSDIKGAEMTEQDRVREAIPTIETLQGGVTTDKYGLALQTMLDLATLYLSIKGVPEEKIHIDALNVDPEINTHNWEYCKCYNLGRRDALLGVLKVLDGGKLEEVIKQVIKDGGGFPKIDVLATAIKSLFGVKGEK